MTNYITAAQFTSITNVTWAEAGEESAASTTIRDAKITKAQSEFILDVEREYDGTENDYELAQEAIAFLTSHRISIANSPNISEGIMSYPHKKEYERILKLLKTSEVRSMATFDGTMSTVTINDIDG